MRNASKSLALCDCLVAVTEGALSAEDIYLHSLVSLALEACDEYLLLSPRESNALAGVVLNQALLLLDRGLLANSALSIVEHQLSEAMSVDFVTAAELHDHAREAEIENFFAFGAHFLCDVQVLPSSAVVKAFLARLAVEVIVTPANFANTALVAVPLLL